MAKTDLQERAAKDVLAVESRLELKLPAIQKLIQDGTAEELRDLVHLLSIAAFLVDKETKFATGELRLKDFVIWKNTSKERINRQRKGSK